MAHDESPAVKSREGYHDDLQDDLSTEANESLMGHGDHHSNNNNDNNRQELPWGNPQRAPPQNQGWSLPCSYATIVLGVLCFVLLIMVVDQPPAQKLKYETAGDITGFVTPVPQQIKRFEIDFSFVPLNSSEFFSDRVRRKWLEIIPVGLGYLTVPQPTRYKDLPQPLHGFGSTVFATSVTHQLTCLYNILEVYMAMEVGKPVEPSLTDTMPHCFDYLRQSIMCCGDTALEGQHTILYPEEMIGSDGWDAKHVCKDYTQVLRFLEDNRADDRIWI